MASSISTHARIRPSTDTDAVAATTGTPAVGDMNGGVTVAESAGVLAP